MMWIQVTKSLLVSVGLLLAPGLSQQDRFSNFAPRPTGAAEAEAQYAANLKAHKDNPDILVLSGLLADRKARKVEVLAEYTGLGGEEIAEFLLVDQSSNHGYEALLWSFAKPSSVHRALEFIGLKPGTPVDPAQLRFWAAGPPVVLSIRLDGESELVPIEKLILDATTGKTLTEEGFIFTGSVRLPPRRGQPEARYAADVREPRAIASVYNERTTVLDVPRKVTQDEAYGKLVVNPDLPLAAGTLLTVLMTPGDPSGKARARQFQLAMNCAEKGTGFVFRLLEDGRALLKEKTDPTPILEKLVAHWSESGVSYVDLRFSDQLSISDVGMTCVLMAKMASMGMVRIGPPADGQLYYKAFVPNRAWETPEKRPHQPWELHLRRGAEEVSGELVLHEPIGKEGQGAPSFERAVLDVSTPEDVRTAVEVKAREAREAGVPPPPPVLLVYAPGSMLHGDVMAFVRPVQDTHRTVFVFIQERNRK
jgi:hypothetical protein